MVIFKKLSGLPPYGAPAKPFSFQKEGGHYASEGIVVEFTDGSGASWVGNFQPCGGNYSTVLPHPNDRDVIVIAGGQGYIVDPLEQQVVELFGGHIETVIEVPERKLVVFGNGLAFEAYGTRGNMWRSRRISWDGIKNIRQEGEALVGDAWTPLDQKDDWQPFRVSLIDGTVQGGSYNGPE